MEINPGIFPLREVKVELRLSEQKKVLTSTIQFKSNQAIRFEVQSERAFDLVLFWLGDELLAYVQIKRRKVVTKGSPRRNGHPGISESIGFKIARIIQIEYSS